MNTKRHLKRGLPPLVTLLSVAALVAACGGGSSSSDSSGTAGTAGTAGAAAGSATGATTGASLTVLIASSGDAETKFVTDTANAWAKDSGNTVAVQPAQDINQELAQGFAGGNAPDVFYVDAGRFGDYAKAGNLYPYADQLTDNADFYQTLRDTFTYDGTQYCAPKDFSTLALEINNTAWKAAGLTDADVPKTWDDLATVAKKLTSGNQVGLAVAPTRDRLGAFLVQNGGYWVNEDSTKASADTPENVKALDFVKKLLADGSAAYPAALDAGWGGEAFGTGRAAMAMEGNWIRGAMKNDYPSVDYQVVELPPGDAGKGTLLFTQCWGVSADSPNQAAAVSLIDFLTKADNQIAAADAFGVMPSRTSAKDAYVAKFPDDAPFIAGGDYGRGPVTTPGIAAVMTDLDAQLESLSTGNSETILKSFDTNAASVLGQ